MKHLPQMVFLVNVKLQQDDAAECACRAVRAANAASIYKAFRFLEKYTIQQTDEKTLGPQDIMNLFSRSLL